MEEDEITEELSLNDSQANSLFIGLTKLISLQKGELQFIETQGWKELGFDDEEEMENTKTLLESMNEDFISILPDLKDVLSYLETRQQTEKKTPSGIILP